MCDTKPAAKAALEEALRALIPAIDGVDAAAPTEAMDRLAASHPFDGAEVEAIFDLCKQGLDAGWLTPRSAGPKVQFGRLAGDMGGYAVDIVAMDDAKGLGHRHTRGEINMCFALEGEPRFDGHPPGWVVFEPQSHHVPTVTGGKMLFVYFTPGGEVEWDPMP